MGGKNAGYGSLGDGLEKAKQQMEDGGMPLLPDLDNIVSVEDVNRAEEAAEKLEQSKANFLAKLRLAMGKVVGVLITAPATHVLYGRAQNDLKKCLEAGGLADLQMQAKWTYAEVYTAKAVEHGIDPQKAAKELVERGILTEGNAAPEYKGVRFTYNKVHYGPAIFDKSVKDLVEETITNLFKMRKAMANAVRAAGIEHAKQMKEGASRSWDDLLGGVEGDYLLNIPQYVHVNRDPVTHQPLGKPEIRESGQLRVRSNGRQVYLADFQAPFNARLRSLCEEIRTKETFTWLSDISRPFKDEPDQTDLFYKFWRILNNAYLGYIQYERCQAMKKNATLSCQEYKKGSDGVCYFYLPDFQYDGRIWLRVPILVERKEKHVYVTCCQQEFRDLFFRYGCFAPTEETKVAKVLRDFTAAATQREEMMAAKNATQVRETQASTSAEETETDKVEVTEDAKPESEE